MPVKLVSPGSEVSRVWAAPASGVVAAGKRFASGNFIRGFLILAFIGYGIYRLSLSDAFKSKEYKESRDARIALTAAAGVVPVVKKFDPFPGATMLPGGKWTVKILVYTPVPVSKIAVGKSNISPTSTPLGKGLQGLCVPPACVVVVPNNP